MVGVVQVEQITGDVASPIYSYKTTTPAKSGVRYMTTDNPDGSLTTYPIPIPTAANGRSGSYWVTTLVNVTGAPSTEIKNLKWYINWSARPSSTSEWHLGLKGDHVVGVSSAAIADCKTMSQGFPSSQYRRASGSEGVYGYHISSNHGYYHDICSSPLSGGTCSTYAFNSQGNALMVQSGQVVGAATGRSLCIVTQVIVGSGALQGDKTDKTATFVYTET